MAVNNHNSIENNHNSIENNYISTKNDNNPIEKTQASTNFTVFTNGNFWSWGGRTQPFGKYSQPTGSYINGSLVVDSSTGKIIGLFESSSQELQKLTNAYNSTITYNDMNGQFILPGFHDSHIHVLNGANSRTFANLEGSLSVTEICERLVKHRNKYPDQKWLIGTGWEQQRFTDKPGVMPSRYELDQYFPDIPVVISRRCHHFICCNTLAFTLCNLDVENHASWDMSDKLKKQIIIANGLPSGIVSEDANDIFYIQMMTTNPNIRRMMENEFKFMAANGIVGVQSNDRGMHDIYTELDNKGLLSTRVFHTFFFEELLIHLKEMYKASHPECESPTLEQIVEESYQYKPNEILSVNNEANSTSYFRAPTANSLISCDRVKLFSDGSLGAKTAALRYPYLVTEEDQLVASISSHFVDDNGEDRSLCCKCQKHFGMLRETPGSMRSKMTIIRNCGLRPEVHAIGDAGAELTINAMVDVSLTGFQSRPVLTHCQLLGEDLVDTMINSQIIANIQPSFVPSDVLFIEKYIPQELYSHAYIWKTLMNNGIVCSGGSDYPIEHPNVLQGLFDAMYRPKEHFLTKNRLVADAYVNEINEDFNETEINFTVGEDLVEPPEAYNKQECMSFAEALYMYTIFGAYAANCDSQNNPNVLLGNLEAGYLADFIVLDQDISQNSLNTLRYANIMQTWVNGKLVFDLTTTKTFQQMA